MGPKHLAGGPGLEPGRDDPESPMLPLHHPPAAEFIIPSTLHFDKIVRKFDTTQSPWFQGRVDPVYDPGSYPLSE